MSFGPFHNTDDPRFTQDPQIRELLDVGVDVTSPWSSTTTYILGQIAQGSDDNLYASLLSGNLDHNPVGDGGVHWVQLGGGGLAPQTHIVVKTVSYQMVATDSGVAADATGGAITQTLPVSPTPGYIYSVIKIDSSVHAVTVQGASGDINGASTDTISIQYASSNYRFDGTNWWKF